MFNIISDYAIHEGGTKYYQVFNIVDKATGRGCVVTHWGAYRAGVPRAPRLHAKGTKVDNYVRHASDTYARKAKKRKDKEYRNWEGDIFETAISSDFKQKLSSLFKDSDAKFIMHHIYETVFDEEDIDVEEIGVEEIGGDENELAFIAVENQNMQNPKWGIF